MTDNTNTAKKPSRPFNPRSVERIAPMAENRVSRGPDRRSGITYVYHDPGIELAVNTALATGRPLLVSGPSGCGKSSLALNVALNLGRRYYEFVVTSSSDAQDLMYKFDAVRRLSDASGGKGKNPQPYVEPGPLWWALDPKSAARRGAAPAASKKGQAHDPDIAGGSTDIPAVLLIDEIDKADPDFPNNLLVPLGSMTFSVPQTGFRHAGGATPLVIITNNAERDLPVPFLRRCIALSLPELSEQTLIEIAKAHIDPTRWDEPLFAAVAREVARLSATDEIEGRRQRLSAAEYLDTVHACQELGIAPDSAEFALLSRIALRKTSADPTAGV